MDTDNFVNKATEKLLADLECAKTKDNTSRIKIAMHELIQSVFKTYRNELDRLKEELKCDTTTTQGSETSESVPENTGSDTDGTGSEPEKPLPSSTD